MLVVTSPTHVLRARLMLSSALAGTGVDFASHVHAIRDIRTALVAKPGVSALGRAGNSQADLLFWLI